MLDFTSALYLGLEHPSRVLRPWSKLTLGVPAALAESASARAAAARLAALIGCERAVLAPSTLHLFWDLFGTEAFRNRPVFLDAGTYPIARWGAQRARVSEFGHYDVRSLRSKLGFIRDRPVVVCDGTCPSCGRVAPIGDYLQEIARCGGTLLIDDTQALGVLGKSGGGVLRRSEIAGPNVVVVSSLAKGFGVPIAVLAGSTRAVDAFERESETRVHCSPPAVPLIHAVEHALKVNDEKGDDLRRRLLTLVRRFKDNLRARGLHSRGGPFPVQSLEGGVEIHERLLRLGIRTVLHRDRHDGTSRVSFLLSARHAPAAIDEAVGAIANLTTFNGAKHGQMQMQKM